MIFAAMMLAITSFAQNTQVIVNGQSRNAGESKDYYYVINGISSKDDIGGVSTSVRLGSVYLKNSNAFTVTVVWESEVYDGKIWSGSVTLQRDEEKEVLSTGRSIIRVSTITRKLSTGIDVPTELKKYKDLLDKEIITKEEFEVKKRKLLNL